ncbi:MAG TPA: NAD-dependent epimerase/dehydratase family protein [Acidimicrobiales bacterium]|nr:NAD-dependent epimerase/dehydratase family protein [Acidimicrobiales bacterium]
MVALVTGAAGFIGSHLTEALASRAQDLRAVDCFTPYYDPAIKRRTAAALADRGIVIEATDLRRADLDALLRGVDLVFHCAAQPGVRASWDAGFEAYVEQNVLVTQRLLEACRRASVARFVYSSSSSIYGNATSYPTVESQMPAPVSPYGVSKLAGEHLCSVYAANFGVPTVSLRYFTVYGPRQRPDMAMWRLIDATRSGVPFPMFGDGSQVRDFTFVGDVVRANIAAADAQIAAGEVINIAGGGSTTLREVIEIVGRAVGTDVPVEAFPPQAGDVERTGGSIEKAKALLGWEPQVAVSEGIARQVEWQVSGGTGTSTGAGHHVEP